MATGTIPKIINDSGSDYCKLADGTLIQWGVANVTFSNSDIANGTIEMPYTTVINPVCVANAQSTSYGFYVLRVGINGTANSKQLSFTAVAGQSMSATRSINWIAIGRWKA